MEKSKKKAACRAVMVLLLAALHEEEEEEARREAEDAAAAEERERFERDHRWRVRALSRRRCLENAGAAELDRLVAKRARILACSVGAALASQQTVQRRLWVKNRSQAWWERCNHPGFPDEEFHQAFRMSRPTFERICEELESIVAKEDTMLRAAIPVKQRVAVCIWRLATGEPLRMVSKRFGLGISTCHKLILEVCAAINDVLLSKYVQWPATENVQPITQEFEAISGVQNVIGAMYTTHIPIIAPKLNVAAYFNKRHTDRNQKTSYSITLQIFLGSKSSLPVNCVDFMQTFTSTACDIQNAPFNPGPAAQQGVVDIRGSFTDVCIGWPGSMPNDRVLESSALYQKGIGGSLEGTWVVGGEGFPLLNWLLVPYAQPSLTWAQQAFNDRLTDIQKVAKGAFSRLKGRWRFLQRRTEVKLQELPAVLGACCVLHNVCEQHNEGFDPNLTYEVVDDMYPDATSMSAPASEVRDAIAEHLVESAGLPLVTDFIE